MSRNQREVLVELLVIQAQAGDPKAIGSLANVFQHELLAHAFRLVADSDISRDIVQDAWVSVMRGIGRLKDPASFRAWVFRIVHNKSMDSLRTVVRNRNELEVFGRSSAASTAVGNIEPPSELNDLKKLIDALTPNDRALLTLYYENNLSIREIASITGFTDSATKSKLFHLRQKLKQQLIDLEGSNNDK